MEDTFLSPEVPKWNKGMVSAPDHKKGKLIIEKKKKNAIEANIFSGLSYTGKYDCPVINPYKIDVPSRLVTYNVWNQKNDADATVCFYIYDYLFSGIKRNLDKTIAKLKNAKSVIFPDFSQTCDMPYALRLYNPNLNKALGAKFQQNGINVIVNATWSLPDSYEYCCEGLPKHCMIAINSMGANSSATSRFLWEKGYKFVVNELEPTCILRYGPEMPFEYREISKYFENPYIKSMRYGS